MAFLQLHKPPLLALLLLLCFCLEPPAVMAGADDTCFLSDLQALRAFAPHIASVSEDHGDYLESESLEKLWGSTDDCCSWQGINCSVDGTPSGNGQPRHVSSLVLFIYRFSNLSFTSNFLQPLCNLSHLSTLYLDCTPTETTTPIPACLISSLPNLTSVGLTGCGLSGPLPPFQTPFLQVLDLGLNYLNSTLEEFTSLSSLPSLTHLSLSFNAISGSIPPSISRLSNLSSFVADFNSLSGEIPDSICKLESLITLNLAGQSGGGFDTSLDSLECSFVNLTFLHLAGNGLMGPFPRWIRRLPSLQILDLSSNLFKGPLPSFQYPFLQVLDLTDNSLDSTLDNFTSLSSLPSLTDLFLSGNLISGSIPPSISRLSNLSSFVAGFNSLSVEIPDSICKLANLRMLTLSSGGFDTSLDSLECSFINLTFLTLAGNGLTGPFPRWIGRSPSLQLLNLSDGLFRGPLPEEWRNLQLLVSLDLSGSSILSPGNDDASLPDWLFHNPLQQLSLASCGLQTRDLSCSGKLALLNHSLLYLKLSDNHLTGGDTLECIALHNFSQLFVLDLSGNPLSIVLSNAHFSRWPQSSTVLILSSCSLKGVEVNSSVKSAYVDLSRNGLAMDLATLLVRLGLHSNCSPNSLYFAEGIDLSHNALVGEIPSFLGLCNSNLRLIRLHNNSLVGRIPVKLGGLTSLEALTLNNNQLTGTIPASIFSISSLSLLDLSYNELKGDINTLFSVSQTIDLQVVLLSHNHLRGSIPISFAGAFMPSLQVIDFSYNRLTGTVPQRLNLPYLQISLQAKDMNRLTPRPILFGAIGLYVDFLLMVKGVELPYSYVLETMTSFDLSSNSIEGEIPAEMGSLAELLFLNLSHNQLSGPIPGSLAKLSQLQALDLSSNKLAGPLPSTLSNLTELSVFNVSYNPGLAGSIPQGPQFESSDSYIGNPQLCGRPALQDCQAPTLIPHPPPPTDQSPPRSALSQWIDEWIELPALALGLVVGFATTLFFLHY